MSDIPHSSKHRPTRTDTVSEPVSREKAADIICCVIRKALASAQTFDGTWIPDKEHNAIVDDALRDLGYGEAAE